MVNVVLVSCCVYVPEGEAEDRKEGEGGTEAVQCHVLILFRTVHIPRVRGEG